MFITPQQVHQSLASERELLVALFGEEEEPSTLSSINGHSNGVFSPRSSTNGDMQPISEIPSTIQLLDKIFESVCRPLKVGQHTDHFM